MLKKKITKAAFDALPAEHKAIYRQDGDNYVLNLQVEVDAADDPGELRRALERERSNAKDEKARADRLQTQLDTLVSDPNKQKDIATLEASWRQKLTDKETDLTKKIDRLTDQLKRALITDKANAIASTLAGENAHLLAPAIVSRLQANLDGDLPTTRVLDSNGGLSAASIEDLEKEFLANPKYGAIIVASKATGGANGNRGQNGGGAPSGKKFEDMNEAERTEYFKRDPERFRADATAYRQAQQQKLRKF